MIRNSKATSCVLMAITMPAYSLQELEDARSGKELDLLLFNGNIEIMVDDILWTIGEFGNLFLLLPSLEALAKGIRQFREGGSHYHVELLCDAGSLWLLRDRGQATSEIAISYRGERTPLVRMKDFDEAVEGAINEFLTTVLTAYPLRRWREHELEILNELVLTWPRLDQLIEAWRHVPNPPTCD